MASINHESKEINIKLVYYGPARSGKTTNLAYMHSQLAPSSRSELIRTSTEFGKLMFFDFLPLTLGGGPGAFQTRFFIFTSPGKCENKEILRHLLNGVDGIVFVADSDPKRADANAASLQELREFLSDYNIRFENFPSVLQYNKRDLPTAMPLEQMERCLNRSSLPGFEAVASDGLGVFNCSKAISKLVLSKLSD